MYSLRTLFWMSATAKKLPICLNSFTASGIPHYARHTKRTKALWGRPCSLEKRI
jgi:hypothetical protein